MLHNLMTLKLQYLLDVTLGLLELLLVQCCLSRNSLVCKRKLIIFIGINEWRELLASFLSSTKDIIFIAMVVIEKGSNENKNLPFDTFVLCY